LNLVPGNGAAVLEVGAGLAWVSRVCKTANPHVRTVAQDVSNECAHACRWVDEYFVGPVESLPKEAVFSLVSMTHVVEHLLDPQATLNALASRVLPNGHVYITAPFRPALWRPRMGIGPWLGYSYLHVPAHIAYLSRRWLAKCATDCGFELVHWDNSHDGYQVFEAVLRKT
jgi:ubiquinone/menaquinone biosynthesis C-methylase UbiE